MPPKKKAAKPKAAKKAAPAPVPQPEPAIISTDFLAGHLWSTYNRNGSIDRDQFMRLLHGHPSQPPPQPAPLAAPQIASVPAPPPPPPPSVVSVAPRTSLYLQAPAYPPVPSYSAGEASYIEVMAEEARLTVEAHLMDYSRVASLLQGARGRYFLLDKSGTNVDLIKRLLSEKRMIRDLLVSDLAMLEGVCNNLYSPPVINAFNRVAVHHKLLELGRKAREIIVLEDRRQKQVNERRERAIEAASSPRLRESEERGSGQERAWATERRLLQKQLKEQSAIIGELKTVLAESFRMHGGKLPTEQHGSGDDSTPALPTIPSASAPPERKEEGAATTPAPAPPTKPETTTPPAPSSAQPSAKQPAPVPTVSKEAMPPTLAAPQAAPLPSQPVPSPAQPLNAGTETKQQLPLPQQAPVSVTTTAAPVPVLPSDSLDTPSSRALAATLRPSGIPSPALDEYRLSLVRTELPSSQLLPPATSAGAPPLSTTVSVVQEAPPVSVTMAAPVLKKTELAATPPSTLAAPEAVAAVAVTDKAKEAKPAVMDALPSGPSQAKLPGGLLPATNPPVAS